MATITTVLHPGVTAGTSDETRLTVSVHDGATVRDLELMLHVAPGTATILIDNRVADAGDVLHDGNIVDCYPLFSGG
jgi:hypothetical protein